MIKLCLLFGSLFFFCQGAIGQKPVDPLLTDTAIYDYDELFSELDALLDSLYTPRSFTVVSANGSTGFYTYTSGSGASSASVTRRQFTLSPSVGYFSQSGAGISAAASLANTGSGLAPFQFALTGSYDYLQKRNFITGISYTHFFTRKDLPFYTSPLKNEVYGYFTLRKFKLKPSLAASYGWGSRESYTEQEESIRRIKLARRGFTRTTTVERVVDFNLTASVRQDVYFLHPFAKDDYFRVTPQLSFTSGTQQFGFNAVSNSYLSSRKGNINVLYNTRNVTLDDQLAFQPLSVTGQLRTEYAYKKFFVQPQLVVDYYLPASSQNFTTTFFLNAGYIF